MAPRQYQWQEHSEGRPADHVLFKKPFGEAARFAPLTLRDLLPASTLQGRRKPCDPQSILQQHLNQFLEQVHETEPDVLRDCTESYLTHWSTGDTRWLRRYFDSQHAESVYQLTPDTEDVLKFLNDVLDRTLGFVGMESRLTRIIETLSDIAVRGSDDPQRRLRHLHYHAGHRSH